MDPSETTLKATLWNGEKEVEFRLPKQDLMEVVVKEVIMGEYPFPIMLRDERGSVVDIGANIGAFTVCAGTFFRNAELFAVEPDERIFPLLEDNCRKNLGRRVSILKAAITGHTAGRAGLYRGDCSVTSSLFASKENKDEQTLQPVDLKPVAWIAERVPKPIVYMKIDTEGNEGNIVYNLRPFLRDILCLAVEYHAENERVRIDNIMRGCRFSLYHAKADRCHRGVNCYMQDHIISTRTNWDEDGIAPAHC